MSNLPKTLYVILNHNGGQISTIYYEEMEHYQEQDNFDLLLIDNGSKPSERSVHTTHSFKKNVYFNGAIQWAFKYMLDHPEYEYLVFSNNDIFLHGYRFVENMVTIAEENNFTMIAPSGIEGNAGQNFWPIMHCWYKEEPRVVPWIDFICPFINRRLIEEIQQFPSWWRTPSYGFDDYCSITCNNKGWKIGVSDLMTIFHIGQYTYREQYGERADDGLDLYTMQNKHRTNFDWNFKKSGLKDQMYELDNLKALYGRDNSLKMGRMPATPDEGYYGDRPTVDRQWFRSDEQRAAFKKREEILENNYLKRKGLK
tara:strand:- start:5050 stop:5985 length:936 start_codon:yes stop_codon:yes gene_type:complete